MTYNQLFKLEDFLASNLCTYTHLNIEKETTFKDAFGPSYTAFFNNTIVEGLYIMIFPESNKDVIATYNNMVFPAVHIHAHHGTNVFQIELE